MNERSEERKFIHKKEKLSHVDLNFILIVEQN
jgi:hypothetical protein